MADQGRFDFYEYFYREPVRTWIWTDVHQFAHLKSYGPEIRFKPVSNVVVYSNKMTGS